MMPLHLGTTHMSMNAVLHRQQALLRKLYWQHAAWPHVHRKGASIVRPDGAHCLCGIISLGSVGVQWERGVVCSGKGVRNAAAWVHALRTMICLGWGAGLFVALIGEL